MKTEFTREDVLEMCKASWVYALKLIKLNEEKEGIVDDLLKRTVDLALVKKENEDFLWVVLSGGSEFRGSEVTTSQTRYDGVAVS